LIQSKNKKNDTKPKNTNKETQNEILKLLKFNLYVKLVFREMKISGFPEERSLFNSLNLLNQLFFLLPNSNFELFNSTFLCVSEEIKQLLKNKMKTRDFLFSA
jgi:hypothetical protein